MSGTLGCVGLLLLGMAGYFWHLGRIPLVIEEDGRTTYRGKEVIAAGAACELFIRNKTVEGEEGPVQTTCLVVRHDGGEVELPAPYFSSLANDDDGKSLADQIGESLRIPVTCNG